MKFNIRMLTLCAGVLALASLPAQGGVSYSLDGSMTTSSTAWSGSPTISLATPSQGNANEGGGTGGGVLGYAFLASSSFNLGAMEFQVNGLTGNNFTLSLYDLGTTTPSASNPRYTIDGSSVNLFTPGLTFSFASSVAQIGVLTFSGADQVTLTSSHWYSLEILNNDPASNLLSRRASTSFQSFLALGVGATGGRNNVPAGDRDPVAAFYAAPVPEPATMTLLGLGALIGAFAIRRRK